MVESRFHALGLDVPFGLVEANFISPAFQNLSTQLSTKWDFVGWGRTREKAKILIFNGFWPFLVFIRPSNGGGGGIKLFI